jgi:predicted metal-dependent phosphoesterase TrpH
MDEGFLIDLHTHSNCSDGTLTPAELVGRAAAAGVQVLALTDHDTVAGLGEAQAAAARCNIALVPGVEISASWRAQAIHVLGLWIDPQSPALKSRLAAQTGLRRERMRKICARLGKLGLPSEKLLTTVQAFPGVPTRLHLAHALVAMGSVENPDAAFRKYLSKGKAAHIAAEWPALDEVIAWIIGAGGVAVLAHPVRYSLSSGARSKLVSDFAAAGGAALEVVTGANGAQHVELCASLAETHGLRGSVGSDFHDPQHSWNPLGRSLKLPDSVTPVWRSYGL